MDKNQKIEMDMPRKEDRVYPLLWIILSYLMGVVLLYFISAPPYNHSSNVLLFLQYRSSAFNKSILENQHSRHRSSRPISSHYIRVRLPWSTIHSFNTLSYMEQIISKKTYLIPSDSRCVPRIHINCIANISSHRFQ